VKTAADIWLREALGLSDEQSPFPWQARLLGLLLDGQLPRALDLPTGLGKTSVLAIWLVARALGAKLPRRLVYVVDRRAVVDQSTKVAEDLRGWVARTPEVREALGLSEEQSLPISTLRGQFVDNREWLDDPASPAIIVGTVDMIGSRLLFGGYGVSRKMRPYQAGLLGADTLFVLDESHLVPAFERLIEQVHEQSIADSAAAPVAGSVPRVQLISLSATGRSHADAFRLSDEDLKNPVVQSRYHAKKQVSLREPVPAKDLPDRLAQEAWDLALASSEPVRILVFSSSRNHADKAMKSLQALGKKGANGRPEPECELFVGGRRIHERQHAAEKLVRLGFLAGSGEAFESDAFVFATAAGEVGVDLDADHVVCDVVAWERLVQRLGRVNRRGGKDRAAQVVVAPTIPEAKKKGSPTNESTDLGAALELLQALPLDTDQRPSASPSALAQLCSDPAQAHRVQAASTPEPLYPPLSRPTLESWAMTSLLVHTGRPEVAPWLRGWVEQRAQSRVVWRRQLPAESVALVELLQAAPPHMAETVTVETWQLVDWLLQACKRLGDEGLSHARLILLDGRGEFSDELGDPRRASKFGLERRLADKTLVVSANFGGLSHGGLLDPKDPEVVETADGPAGWQVSADEEPEVPWCILREVFGAPATTVGSGWGMRSEIPVHEDPNSGSSGSSQDEPTHVYRVFRWRGTAETEDDRSVSHNEQALAEHHDWTARQARSIGARLGLAVSVASAIELAAKLHDEGKRAERWQRAFSAPSADGPYAKTRGPVRTKLLQGYRHEFGSLGYVEAHPELSALSLEDQDLVVHLIAAHHGWARPNISWEGLESEPPSIAKARARQVALRFIRVQERWGVWGTAYLEALLRAADQQASRKLEEVQR